MQQRRKAIVVDIDGTVALRCDRSPYDISVKLLDDQPNWPVLDVARAMWLMGSDVIFLSGRMDKGDCRKYTMQWLSQYLTYNHSGLFMRPEGDFRKDSEVKWDLYSEHVEPFYDVTCVLDDRDQVVQMWRTRAKLCCLQVNYGDF